MSATPRTDAAMQRSGGLLDMRDHAMALERENQALREALEAVRVIGRRIVKTIPEYAYEMGLVRAALKTKLPSRNSGGEVTFAKEFNRYEKDGGVRIYENRFRFRV
jgi:hypothetical protein